MQTTITSFLKRPIRFQSWTLLVIVFSSNILFLNIRVVPDPRTERIYCETLFRKRWRFSRKFLWPLSSQRTRRCCHVDRISCNWLRCCGTRCRCRAAHCLLCLGNPCLKKMEKKNHHNSRNAEKSNGKRDFDGGRHLVTAEGREGDTRMSKCVVALDTSKIFPVGRPKLRTVIVNNIIWNCFGRSHSAIRR